jgi:hypothetical protein
MRIRKLMNPYRRLALMDEQTVRPEVEPTLSAMRTPMNPWKEPNKEMVSSRMDLLRNR